MTSYFLQWNHPAEGNPHGPDFPVRDHDRGAEACKSLVSGKASSYRDDSFLHRKAIYTMRPRVMTVVDMMVLPLVVAIEIAAVQSINRLSYRSWWFTIVQVPFVTIEVTILIKIGLELWRTRKCPPFLFGFGAFGVGAIVAIWFVFFDIHHFKAFQGFTTLWIWRLAPAAWTRNYSFQIVLQTTSFLTVLLPQILIAAIGGWLAHHLGITLVRSERSLSTPAESDVVSSNTPLVPSSQV